MSGAIAVLFSGRGTNLQALLRAEERFGYRVVAAVANRPCAPGLAIAAGAGVATRVVDHRAVSDRPAFEAALAAALEAIAPDYLVLAGFMRILSEAFVAPWHGRMINVHPSLLPDFPGLDTHRRVLAAGHREHGASVHFVTAALDGGPVIARARLPVASDDTPERLAARLLPLEHRLLPRCAGWLATGRLTLSGETVRFDGRPLSAPLEPLATLAA